MGGVPVVPIAGLLPATGRGGPPATGGGKRGGPDSPPGLDSPRAQEGPPSRHSFGTSTILFFSQVGRSAKGRVPPLRSALAVRSPCAVGPAEAGPSAPKARKGGGCILCRMAPPARPPRSCRFATAGFKGGGLQGAPSPRRISPMPPSGAEAQILRMIGARAHVPAITWGGGPAASLPHLPPVALRRGADLWEMDRGASRRVACPLAGAPHASHGGRVPPPSWLS